MSSRPPFGRNLLRRAAVPVALTLAAAPAFGATTASAEHARSAGHRCTGLFVVGAPMTRTGSVYNLSCARARSYSRHAPAGWSGALQNYGTAQFALIYRSRDANRVLSSIRRGGSSVNTRTLGRRPLVVIRVPAGQ